MASVPFRGRFHKPIYALRQALMLCVKLLHPKKASQKLGAESKMALRPTFSLHEIDPRSFMKVTLNGSSYHKLSMVETVTKEKWSFSRLCVDVSLAHSSKLGNWRESPSKRQSFRRRRERTLPASKRR